MKMILHTPSEKGMLSDYYHQAFEEAKELFIVTAYLTEWDKTLELNSICRGFRLIVGKDFGITRKAACEAVMKWLPARRKSQFLVADLIDGFHPKAIFWTDGDKFHAVVGSSNLTKAAFEINYEVNVYSRISKVEYESAKKWVKQIEKKCIVVSKDWISEYKEAKRSKKTGTGKDSTRDALGKPLVALWLPNPRGREKLVFERRKQLKAYQKKRKGLISLFKKCASGTISSRTFYEQLPNYWSYEIGDRLQGRGWERQGKSADFKLLSESYLRILDSHEDDRDDTVAEEIDHLATQGVPARTAFLSEMLCLEFSKQYPVLNDPVHKYLGHVKFEAPRGASEGAKYIDLAKKLRFSLIQNPDHVAKNIAELDSVIWLAYGKR